MALERSISLLFFFGSYLWSRRAEPKLCLIQLQPSPHIQPHPLPHPSGYVCSSHIPHPTSHSLSLPHLFTTFNSHRLFLSDNKILNASIGLPPSLSTKINPPSFFHLPVLVAYLFSLFLADNNISLPCTQPLCCVWSDTSYSLPLYARACTEILSSCLNFLGMTPAPNPFDATVIS